MEPYALNLIPNILQNRYPVGSELISIPGDSPTNELYGVSSIRLVDILGDVMASIDANNGNTGNFLHQ